MTTSTNHKSSIINIDDVPLERHTHGEKFDAKDGGLSPLIGMKQLGCSLTVVPPGKRCWPIHNHHVNEEMFVILEGSGTLRVGAREPQPIKKGDVISCPAGGRETAHQIVNTSSAELKYLSISTEIPNDVIEYPDSNKILVRVGDPYDRNAQTIKFRGRLGAETEYWEGE